MAEDGIVKKASRWPVGETLDRLEAVLRAKGVTVFARIDHAGEAAKVGLTMAGAQVLIFGNPKGGTPIMVENPVAAIDLPLKALAWEDSTGAVWLGYTDPEFFKERFGLSDGVVKAIRGIEAWVEAALSE